MVVRKIVMAFACDMYRMICMWRNMKKKRTKWKENKSNLPFFALVNIFRTNCALCGEWKVSVGIITPFKQITSILGKWRNFVSPTFRVLLLPFNHHTFEFWMFMFGVGKKMLFPALQSFYLGHQASNQPQHTIPGNFANASIAFLLKAPAISFSSRFHCVCIKCRFLFISFVSGIVVPNRI